MIVIRPDYVPGGATTALATNFVDGSYLPFEDQPQAAMYHLGVFTQGFIAEQSPELVAGKDYAFFPFPTIHSSYAGVVSPRSIIGSTLMPTPTRWPV
jgi:alpha-glucoside transport system substrate-binding protein